MLGYVTKNKYKHYNTRVTPRKWGVTLAFLLSLSYCSGGSSEVT